MIATSGFRQRTLARSAARFRDTIVTSGAPPTNVSAASDGRSAPAAAEVEDEPVGLGERAGERAVDHLGGLAGRVRPEPQIADAETVALDDLGAVRDPVEERPRRLQFGDGYRDLDRLGVPRPAHRERDGFPGAILERRDLAEGQSIDGEDFVPRHQPGPIGRAAVIDIGRERRPVDPRRGHADALVADIAVGREQPPDAVADRETKDVHELVVVDIVRRVARGVRGLEAAENEIDGVSDDGRIGAGEIGEIGHRQPDRVAEAFQFARRVEIGEHQLDHAVEHGIPRPDRRFGTGRDDLKDEERGDDERGGGHFHAHLRHP